MLDKRGVVRCVPSLLHLNDFAGIIIEPVVLTVVRKAKLIQVELFWAHLLYLTLLHCSPNNRCCRPHQWSHSKSAQTSLANTRNKLIHVELSVLKPKLRRVLNGLSNGFFEVLLRHAYTHGSKCTHKVLTDSFLCCSVKGRARGVLAQPLEEKSTSNLTCSFTSSVNGGVTKDGSVVPISCQPKAFKGGV